MLPSHISRIVWTSFALMFCLFSAPVIPSQAAPQGAGYHLVRKMPVGGEGAWDYLTVDPDAHRIYLSRSTHVMVVDEISGKVIGDITGTQGVHGVALARDLGRGFTSNGGANSVTIFDLNTLKIIATVPTSGQNPDFIIYDPATKRVFTMNGGTANSTVLDAVSGSVVGTVALGGKPETAVLDGKGSMFVNIEDKNQEVEFDTRTLAVRHTYSLAPCEAPTGNSIDTIHRRLFIGCSDNKMMAILNADTGKLVAMPTIGDGTDATAFDPETALAFASCREGILSIVHEDSPDKFTVVTSVKTQSGARTMALDPKTHHAFTVTADFQPASASGRRPQAVPGTFMILEFAP